MKISIAISAWSTFTLLALTAGSAHALEKAKYEESTFKEASKNNKIAVIDFHADWCPTCKSQEKAIDALSKDPDLQSVTVFTADFDQEKDLKKTLGVQKQSTLVVFKNGKEVGRSTGTTDPKSIKALIKAGT
jgi:thioredoxin 1